MSKQAEITELTIVEHILVKTRKFVEDKLGSDTYLDLMEAEIPELTILSMWCEAMANYKKMKERE